MSSSSQTYKDLSIPFFEEVFRIIDQVLTEKHIPFYLVGVNAIALELSEKGHKPSRGTRDIDFAIMMGYLEMHLIENAPHNFGTKKTYLGVAGNLVAFACKMSFELRISGVYRFYCQDTAG
jgi:hypothetical protein